MTGTAVDTSVAVPLLVASHPAHSALLVWAEDRNLALAGHALAETYSVLTRLPGDARVAPRDAVQLIDDRFPQSVGLPKGKLAAVHRELAEQGVAGGAVYDGMVALAAAEHRMPLATRDARARATYEALGIDVELLP